MKTGASFTFTIVTLLLTNVHINADTYRICNKPSTNFSDLNESFIVFWDAPICSRNDSLLLKYSYNASSKYYG